jgi:hypothetical protein
MTTWFAFDTGACLFNRHKTLGDLQNTLHSKYKKTTARQKD